MAGFFNAVTVRFSLRLSADWSERAHGGEAGRADWFAMRARMLRDWLAVAIARQTLKPDLVCICMDTDDAALWDRHLALPAPFLPVFCAADRMVATVGGAIRARADRDVIHARIDSDDAIARSYFAALNETAAQEIARGGQRPFHMTVTRGFITDFRKVQEIGHNCPPFIARYLPVYGGESACDVPHRDVILLDPVACDGTAWMQILHGTNLANRFRRQSPFAEGDPRRMTCGPILPARGHWPDGFGYLRRHIFPRPADARGGRP